MKLGLITGYSGAKINLPMEAIKHAEGCGYDSVWTSEAYGSDAITPAAWILANTTKIRVGTAIMQMPARTPAMAAMTATSSANHASSRSARLSLPVRAVGAFGGGSWRGGVGSGRGTASL
jgi:hypothetical protein